METIYGLGLFILLYSVIYCVCAKIIHPMAVFHHQKRIEEMYPYRDFIDKGNII